MPHLHNGGFLFLPLNTFRISEQRIPTPQIISSHSITLTGDFDLSYFSLHNIATATDLHYLCRQFRERNPYNPKVATQTVYLKFRYK